MPPAAAIGGGLALGGVIGLMNARSQAKAAQAAAYNASQPVYTRQNTTSTSTSMPTGPYLDQLGTLVPDIFSAYGTPLPEFPGFVGAGLRDLNLPTIGLGDVNLQDVSGASARSNEILNTIIEMARDKSGVYQPAEKLYQDFLEGGGNEYLTRAGAMLDSGPLFDLASGVLDNPYNDLVVEGLRGDFEETLADVIARVRAGAGAARRTGSNASDQLVAEITEAGNEDLARQIGLLRQQSFESERNRQTQGIMGLSGLAQNLAGIRSGDIRAGLALAPELERARFAGFDIAGPLSAQLDSLDQAALIAENDFALREAIARGQLTAAQANALLQAAGLRLSEAGQLNSYNLSRLGYESGAPFMRLNQALASLLPIIQATTGTTVNQSSQSSGMNQQNQIPVPTQSPFAGLLSGALGGAALGYGLRGGFGGGGAPLTSFALPTGGFVNWGG